MTPRTTRREQGRGRDPKQVYERVCGIVEKQTGGKQPALAPRSSVLAVAGNAGIPASAARPAIRKAVQDDELLEVDGRLARVTEPGLVGVIEAECDREDGPRQGLVARCNELLDDVRAGDGGER